MKKLKYKKLWWALGLIGFCVATFLFLVPFPPVGPPLFPFFDKFVHFLIHLSLTSYFAAFCRPHKSFFFFLLYGVFIEWAQTKIPFRGAEPFDLLANVLGGSVAYFLVWKYVQRAIISIDLFLFRRVF